jgi:hypothetical protein
MSGKSCNTAGYNTLKTTWVKQDKYRLATGAKVKERFGAFSISAAVRPPYSHKWANPWTRQETYYGVN